MNDDTAPITRADLADAVRQIQEAQVANLAELRAEVRDMLSHADRRADRMAQSLDHLANLYRTIANGLDRTDKDTAALSTNYHTLSREVRELRARLEALEKKAS
jgi:predicted nuclease with TOPRIM domain